MAGCRLAAETGSPGAEDERPRRGRPRSAAQIGGPDRRPRPAASISAPNPAGERAGGCTFRPPGRVCMGFYTFSGE